MRGRILKRYPTYSTTRPHPLHTHGEALNRYEKTNMVLGLNSIDNTSPSLIGSINTAHHTTSTTIDQKIDRRVYQRFHYEPIRVGSGRQFGSNRKYHPNSSQDCTNIFLLCSCRNSFFRHCRCRSRSAITARFSFLACLGRLSS